SRNLPPMSLLLAVALAADTFMYLVMNHGRQAGEMRVVRDADSVVVTYAHIDRNRGRWLQNRYTLGPDGSVIAAEARPMTRDGVVSAASERYRVDGNDVAITRNAQDRRFPRRDAAL